MFLRSIQRGIIQVSKFQQKPLCSSFPFLIITSQNKAPLPFPHAGTRKPIRLLPPYPNRRLLPRLSPLPPAPARPPATSMAGRHTIILMQPSQNRASRTFMDYNSINHALDGICGLYERKIRDINPMVPNITYDISDLYNFIDGLADISALVFDHSIQAFLPYDRQWIKQKLFQHLKKLSQR
nr:hypothetical protein SEVIR_1G233700v2 [Setaria viridis]